MTCTRLFAVLCLAFSGLSARAAVETYAIDPVHSSVGFSIRHFVSKVPGSFTKFQGTITVDRENLEKSSVTATIDTASITTNQASRDSDLKSPNFFDVEKFPTMKFESKSWKKTGEDQFDVAGDLTIKGITKPITVEFESTGSARDPFGNVRIGFEGQTTLSRKDWGLTWNAALETGGFLVSDKIKLDFDISAIQK